MGGAGCGSQFPSLGIDIGHIFYHTVRKTTYQYIGGSARSESSWITLGTSGNVLRPYQTTTDPDSAAWGSLEEGYVWFNTVENQLKMWNGTAIVVLNSTLVGKDHGSLSGLSDDDHTQYLRTDGSRILTDNLAVTALKTIDGRDISVDGTKLDLLAPGADVVGPSSAVDSNLAEFNTTTGKLIKDSLLTHAGVSGAVSATHAANHTATHTNGTDDVQSATAGQKGLMTSTYAGKLDGIEAGADVTDITNVAAAGAVMATLYNAQTILAATTDDTPAPLTVGEQTLVGRITSGNIAALTTAQVRTLLDPLDGRPQTITPANSVTIDWSAGATAMLSLNRASTAITMTNPTEGKVYRVLLAQDGTGGRLATWTDTIRWRGGSAPVLTATVSKSDWITLIYANSAWYADVALNF